jgi:carbamoyl-phosphate synthase small subunit
MQECNVPGIYGVDTRELVQMIRDEGIIKAALVDIDCSKEELDHFFVEGTKLPSIAEVSSKKTWYSRTPNYRYNIVAVDCGITNSVIKSLKLRDCNVIIVPFDTTKEEILTLRPDGILISDGPGFPKETDVVVSMVRSLVGSIPIMGIGLGFLGIAVAFGHTISEKRVMHFGSNHPIRDEETSRIFITSQNHSYIVEEFCEGESELSVTHRNLTDSSIEGVLDKNKQVIAVAFHPESTSDDTDSSYIYDSFIAMIDMQKAGKEVEDA